ncbi:MAG: response regulator [Eubacteriales bacterium]|nr:response regulator [Eubacteriales bacterium]
MKVLLADDNPLILNRFVKMAEWKNYGFDTVLTAADGIKAWTEFEKHRPQLVIVDIQMPRMTGIELAQKIFDEGADTFVYFLTSYEEYSYVKSALDLGVCGYLLKHETKKENLEKILMEVQLEIKKRKLHSRFTAEASLRALVRMLRDGAVSTDEICEYELSLPDRYNLFMLEQDHIYPIMAEIFDCETMEIEEAPLIKYVYHVINKAAAVIHTGKFQYLLLVKSGVPVTETAYEIKKELGIQFRTTFTVLIIAEQASIAVCMEKLRKNNDIAKQKYFYARSTVAHGDYIGTTRHISRGWDTFKADCWMKNKEFAKVSRWMDETFFLSFETRDEKRLGELCGYFSRLLLQYHNRIAHCTTGLPFMAYDRQAQEYWYDANSIYQWIKQKFAELVFILDNPCVNRYSEIVNLTIEYVNRNYTNSDLGLELIAQELKISANRLNVIFKKETGETIWKLIIRVRMERAKELLNMEDDKVTEICRKTGYKNISYFSKVFKDTYGLTPLEYRRRKHYEI